MPSCCKALGATFIVLAALAHAAGSQANPCYEPGPPVPYIGNPHISRSFIQTADTADYMRLVNVLGTAPPLGPDTGGTYSQILVGYDARNNTVQVLTAYHNLTHFLEKEIGSDPISLSNVREYFLKRTGTMHRAYLSRELVPYPGSYFCKLNAHDEGLRTVRMVRIDTPAINDNTPYPDHPVDLALVTYELEPDEMLNVSELYRIDEHFAINGQFGSADLPALVDQRVDIELTGWGQPFVGDLQMLTPNPHRTQARYLGIEQPDKYAYRASILLYQEGPVLSLSGFSGGGVFLRRPKGKHLLLGIDSGQRRYPSRTIFFTNLYNSPDNNLLDWLREHMMHTPGSWHMRIEAP